MSRQAPRPDSGLYQDWKSWANALLRYLTLVEEESTLSAGTQVKTYASTDVPSAEQAGQIIYQTDTLKMSASFNAVWNDFAFLSGVNTWTGIQTIEAAVGIAGLILSTSDDGASRGPLLLLDRVSTSPALLDNVGMIIYRGRDSGGNAVEYGTIACAIASATDGAEGGFFGINTMQTGVVTSCGAIGPGWVIGAGTTGGFMGAGTLNMSAKLYRDGVALLDARKTGWAVDTGTAKRTANATYSGTASAGYVQAEMQAVMDALRDATQTIKALKDDLHATAGHGLIGT